MQKLFTLVAALAVGAAVFAVQPVNAANVKITPLGSHKGDFCRYDRAMILEDPDGTRLLYDAGRTVRGAGDSRLGKIDALLVSHIHGDHVGDQHQATADAGDCSHPDFAVKDAPNTNSVNIAIAKKAKIVVGSEMNFFLAGKMGRLGGDPKSVKLVRFGASTSINGVKITTVPAAHSNGINAAFIDDPTLAKAMKESGLTAYAGPPTGYVVTFTNGLVVYLSGDTGITAEQDRVVRGYYHANMAVINIGDVFTTGPNEAAYVINELVKPNSVIASHANEPATKDGKLIAGTRTAIFKKAVRVPVHIPLSERTMEFDGKGKCVAGC